MTSEKFRPQIMKIQIAYLCFLEILQFKYFRFDCLSQKLHLRVFISLYFSVLNNRIAT